ncbi:MAG TPA: hypothetical protein VK464_08525 [Symbiobacteriaceae bacterium]|nr:hypothetical protein [Symbiobacteriaceae bacterium]
MSGLNLHDGTVVELFPLHIGDEGEEQSEVGRADTGIFIGLPAEGVALVRWLQEGVPLGEVKQRFARQYGQAPDLEDFVAGLAECGFVRAVDGQPLETGAPEGEVAATSATSAPPAMTPAPRQQPQGWLLFATLPQERVAWLLSKPMVVLYWTIWITLFVTLILRPDLIPSPRDIWVTPRVMVNSLLMILTSWTMGAVHETAHLLTVRARGCTGSLSISHRLTYVVAHVDMTGVRTLPRAQRYAPYVAGMTWDAALWLACLGLRLAGVNWAPLGVVAFLCMVSLLFQCAFFMRTDLYYVFANYFRLGNLMEDTQRWLVNQANRIIGRPEPHDLSAVPPREIKVIGKYAVFYVLGVAVVFGQFIFLGLPVLYRFLVTAVSGLMAGPRAVAFWDGLIFFLLIGIKYGVLAVVTWRERRERRLQAVA